MKPNEPMPLSELPEYIKQIRENGPTDYVPVVDMGRIVDEPRSGVWSRMAYGAALSLFLIVGSAVTYGVAASKSITIVTKADSKAIADMVSEGGGRVVSVKQNEEGAYEVRVFTLRSMSSFLENLRKNKDFKRVEPKE